MKKEWASFEESKKMVQELGIKSLPGWRKLKNRPDNIPLHPNLVYKDQWKGSKDWFGTKMLSFEEARNLVRELGLTSAKQWRKYVKYGLKPSNIPSDPNIVYKNQWVDWHDWLGKVKTKPLRITHPEIFKQINFVKVDETINLDNITAGSNKKLPFICDKYGHEWTIAVCARTRKDGPRNCPFCSGHRTCLDNCLATINPEIAAQWHPTKNGNKTPYDVTFGSNKKTWWYREECGHEWEATINNRTSNNTGCPECAKKLLSDKISGSKHHRWNQDREEVRLKQVIHIKCKDAIRICLKVTNQKKMTKTEIILGYTRNDLKNHIINHPNWLNIKDLNWHLDHVFPIKVFIEYGITDLKVINALDNLQPLSAEENLIKNDSYIKEEFHAYLASKYSQEFLNEAINYYNFKYKQNSQL